MKKAELVVVCTGAMSAMGLDPNQAHVVAEWADDRNPGAVPGSKLKVRKDVSRAEALASVLVETGVVKLSDEHGGKGGAK